MNLEEKSLWETIENYDLDEGDAPYSFSMRLAEENQWSMDFTLRAIDEYKKFMFLATVCNHAVAPTDVIDQVWHLHLIYTKSYWIEFCRTILKKDIHHNPARGNEEETNELKDLFQKTLSSYSKYFGSEAPTTFWSHPIKRKPKYQRIDRNQYYLIKKFI